MPSSLVRTYDWRSAGRRVAHAAKREGEGEVAKKKNTGRNQYTGNTRARHHTRRAFSNGAIRRGIFRNAGVAFMGQENMIAVLQMSPEINISIHLATPNVISTIIETITIPV